jgi:hypothetical protein
MNPQHNMVLDKIKGHSYNFSVWQYYEVTELYDPEMQYITYEAMEMFRAEHTKQKGINASYAVRDFFRYIATAVYRSIAEREQFQFKIDDSWVQSDITKVVEHMIKAYRKIFPDAGSGKTIEELTDMFMMYAIHAALTIVRYQQL